MTRGNSDSVDAGGSKKSRRASRSTGNASSTTRRASASDASAPAQLDGLPEGKLYYRIGEVAKITGVKPHVLRYWETEFRWMSPPKSRSKQRLYRRKDIEMIAAIKRLLYEERYTIAGARQRLRELGLSKAREGATQDDAAQAASTASKADEPRLARGPLARLRAELAEIRAVLAEPIV